MKWQRPATACCGISTKNLTLHRRSALHRHYARFLRLATDPHHTYDTIGVELGITRERVRQLINKLGLLAKREGYKEERKRARRAERERAELANTPMGRFLKECATRGLKVERIRINSHESYGIYNKRFLFVSGKLVAVKRVGKKHPIQDNFYTRLVNTTALVDIVAFEMEDGRWALYEQGTLPRQATSVVMDSEVADFGKGITYTRRHHYRDGIEAWGLLAAAN